ncbi:MAG TPA: hypothetical protein VKO87_08310, partial [Gemmatimonadaceae bacterium]|nr:hypothetical protein [Gemmatimonadaceae bacterium]
MQQEMVQVQRLAGPRPAAPKALTGVTRQGAARKEERVRVSVPRQLVQQLLALPSLRALQAVQQ